MPLITGAAVAGAGTTTAPVAPVTNAVVARAVVLVPGAAVGAVGVPVKAGSTARAMLPVPVVGVNVGTPAANNGTPAAAATLMPKPPRAADSVPFHPTVMLVGCSSALAGVPPSASVTLVSSVRVSAAAVAIAIAVNPSVARAVGASTSSISERPKVVSGVTVAAPAPVKYGTRSAALATDASAVSS